MLIIMLATIDVMAVLELTELQIRERCTGHLENITLQKFSEF